MAGFKKNYILSPNNPENDTDDKMKLRVYLSDYFSEYDTNGYLRISRAAMLAMILSFLLVLFLF